MLDWSLKLSKSRFIYLPDWDNNTIPLLRRPNERVNGAVMLNAYEEIGSPGRILGPLSIKKPILDPREVMI